MELTHINENYEVNMVSTTNKEPVKRIARAYGRIEISPKTVSLITENRVKKGNVLAAAKISGIMAAKKTPEIIPLTHNIQLDCVDVDFSVNDDHIEIFATVETTAKTGVEMEALSAVSAAALTIYDMCKFADKKMVISEIKLLEKQKLKEFRLLSINISDKKGVAKNPVEKALFIENYGLQNDAHAGEDSTKQVSMIDKNDVDKFFTNNPDFKGKYGLFGENLSTSGLNFEEISIRTKIYMGESVLEVTAKTKECHSGCTIKQLTGDCPMRTRGIFAKVIKGGEITRESSCYYSL